MLHCNRIARTLTCFTLLSILSIGCGGKPESRYIPTEELSRDALQTVLDEWKSGKPHGTIEDFQEPIDTLDARWQTGKKLESFEILREEKSDGPKIFVVKMKVEGEKEEQEVKYYVFGKSPLHVFGEKEYNKAAGIGS